MTMKTIKPRIVVEQVPNRDIHVYHVTMEVSNTPLHEFRRPIERPSSDKYLKEVGERGTKLVKSLLHLPGVDDVWISPYRLSVTKGNAFDWDDIEPEVLAILKKGFGRKVGDVQVFGSHYVSPKPIVESEVPKMVEPEVGVSPEPVAVPEETSALESS